MKIKNIILSFLIPILFLTASPVRAEESSEDGGLVLTLEELKEYNGKDGKPAYVAIDGVIYDLSEVEAWANGEHNGFEAGNDLTEEIKEVSPHGTKVLEDKPVVGHLEGYEAAGEDKGAKPYVIMAWLAVASLVIMLSPFILVRLNKYVFKTKNPTFFKFIKFLRKIHKPLGVIFAIVALIHGYLALGTFKLHTGTLLFASILITAILGAVFYFKKNKTVFKFHKAFALITVILFIIHFFLPWLI